MTEVMRREILSQPQLLADCLPKLRDTARGLDLSVGRIVAGGCGDGLFAAGAAAGMFADSDLDYHAASALEIGWHVRLGADDLVVLISISGGTRRTVEAAHRACATGARTLAITCEAQSELAQACEQRLLLPFTPLSRRTPHTADYLVSLLALAVLAESCSGDTSTDLERLPALLEQLIDRQQVPTASLARELAPEGRIFILGHGANLATAQYIAAKFHESGGLNAFWNETENFVHGMNFMIEADDLVCVIAGDGPGSFRGMELSPGLLRLASKTALIGAAAELPDSADAALFNFDAPALPPTLTVFPAAVIGQLLCLGLVEAAGLPVERPRAGRARAELHAEVQRGWMMQTKVHKTR